MRWLFDQQLDTAVYGGLKMQMIHTPSLCPKTQMSLQWVILVSTGDIQTSADHDWHCLHYPKYFILRNYFNLYLHFTATDFFSSGTHYLLWHYCASLFTSRVCFITEITTPSPQIRRTYTTFTFVQLVGIVKEAFHALCHSHQTHSTHTSQAICCLQCSVMLPMETFERRKCLLTLSLTNPR